MSANGHRKRISAAAGSVVFFFAAPVMVAGVVPWWISGWAMGEWSLWVPGVPMIAAGLIVLVNSVVRFAMEGLGTPAPVYPTQRLVVRGLYRYVRNPMYIAVFSIIAGQGLVLGNVRVLVYGLAVWLIFNLFVLMYEEPTLRATYGAEYEEYCRNVPRWISLRWVGR